MIDVNQMVAKSCFLLVFMGKFWKDFIYLHEWVENRIIERKQKVSVQTPNTELNMRNGKIMRYGIVN